MKQEKATFEATEKKVTMGLGIDCDGKYEYKKTLEEIKTDFILREMQIEDFFNAMQDRIKGLKGSKNLGLLKLGYEEALIVFVNGK